MMTTCPTETLEQELSTVCADELFRQVSDFLKKQGFGSCAYELETPVPIFCPKVIAFSYGPQEDLLPDSAATAPGRNHSVVSSSAFATSGLGVPMDYTGAARPKWVRRETLRDRSGVIGRLTLATQYIEPSAQIFASAMTAWILRIVHDRMVRILLPKLIPEAGVTMTCREKEILRWTAEGKTASEIGQILGLTERTVNFHINNVVKKFGSTNKINVAVKAMALGMLS